MLEMEGADRFYGAVNLSWLESESHNRCSPVNVNHAVTLLYFLTTVLFYTVVL